MCGFASGRITLLPARGLYREEHMPSEESRRACQIADNSLMQGDSKLPSGKSRKIRLTVLMLLLSGTVAYAVILKRPPASEEPFPDDIRQALKKGEKVELLSLDPGSWYEGPDNFHGFHMIGKTAVNDAAMRRELRESLFASTEGNKRLTALCFGPRHGLSIKWKSHSYDFVICFHCSQIRFYVDGHRQGGTGTVATPEPLFDRILTAGNVRLAAKSN